MRILVVEDEKKIAQAIQKSLEAEHYAVTLAHTAEAGFFLVSSQTFDLVILDWMLPQRSGLEILTAL
ncbi:MAG: response regulator, partial [Gammaproteobacteria bacterium]|nr:response regulator [Gammaproteobacteria bacterium]